jgi:hypothetical protein
MSTPFRRRVELQAGPVLVLFSRLPKIVPFAVVLGLLITGLLVGGSVGALLLGVLALLLATLLYLAWPALLPQARYLRLAVVLAVTVRAVLFLV